MTRDPAPQPEFAGFSRPNYTQVPDELFDLLMPTLADNELRVLLYIVRRTFGFKRESDAISLSQMISGITTREGQVLDAGTGLSKSTVARGLKSLREKGIIVATRNASKERGDQPTTYRLRFKTDPSSESTAKVPLSRQQDTPRVAPARQAVLQPRDTQETVSQETIFESSKGETLEGDWNALAEEQNQTVSNPRQSGASLSEGALSELLKHRIRRDASRDERQMISVAIGRIANELGDKAAVKSSISRTMHLYQVSDTHIAGFVDLLYQVRGEVLDRYRNPGKAPIPRNRMAYFFAVVGDKLGLRADPHGGAR